MNTRIYFGPWEFDTDSGELKGEDDVKRLEPTIARLLTFMYENQGRVVRRDELITHVWHNRIVSDDPINRSVSVLRQVLTPTDKQAIIKTIPRKGYRAEFPPATEERAAQQTAARPLLQGDTQASVASTWRSKKLLVLVVALCLIVVALAVDWSRDVPQAPAKPRLAVLPFVDLSEASNMGYLTSGISDTIIHLVSRVEGIEVTARTSSFRYQNSATTMSQIAQDLNVNYVLEGSVQVFNNKMRVLARLIDVSSETELWSENFTRDFTDVFSVQDDIASAVIISLNGLVIEHQNTYEPAYETYQMILKGLDAANRMTTAGDGEAIALFEQAIAAEPAYPLSYTLLARILTRQIDTNTYLQIYPSRQQMQTLERVESLVSTSLELNPLSSEAHNIRALLLRLSGQVAQAGQALQRALQLQPNNATALADYAYWLQRDGKAERALQTARKAHSLDPKSSYVNQTLAQVLWLNGRAEEAITIINNNIAQNPGAANNYSLLYRWSLQQGQPGQAMLYAMQEKAIDPDDANSHWGVCLMHYQLWQRERGDACATTLLERFPDYYEAQAWLAYSQPQQAIPIIKRRIAQFPHVKYHYLQLSEILLFEGRYEEVVSLLSPLYPELFTTPVEVSAWSLWAIRAIAFAEVQRGNAQRVEPMLKAGLTYVERSRKLLGGGFSTGIDDAHFLMMLGRHDEAFTRLSDAIDNHWSFYSMTLPYDYIFSPMLEQPEFKALVARQASFMQRQVQWYQARL